MRTSKHLRSYGLIDEMAHSTRENVTAFHPKTYMSQHLAVAIISTIVLFSFFLLSFASVAAQEAGAAFPSSFQLVDVGDSYAITGTKALTTGVRLFVQNVTSATITVAMQVDRLQPVAATGEPIALLLTTAITESNQLTIAVAPAETKVVTITTPALAEKSLKAGVYTGLLLLWDERSRDKQSTVLRFTVPEDPVPAGAAPLVEEWQIYGYRNPKFVRTPPFLTMAVARWQNEFLPLTQAVTTTDTITTSASLGKIIKDNEELAFVYWTGSSPRKEGVPALQLGFALTETSAFAAAAAPHLHVGKYEGSIKLHPQDQSEAKLTVNITDSVWYPLVVLLLGIVLAWSVKQWAGLRRKINELLTQEPALREKFWGATKQGDHIPGVKESFETAIRRNDWAAYTIEKDLKTQLQQARNLLRQWKWYFIPVLDENDVTYKAAKEHLAQAAQAIDGWQTFATDLETLNKVLAELDFKSNEVPPGSNLPGDGQHEPAFVKGARSLLKPEEGELGLTQFLALQPQVLNATKLTQQWAELAKSVQTYRAWIQKLENSQAPMTEPDKKLLGLVKRLVSEVQWEIWHASDLDDLVKRKTVLDVERAERILAQLNFYLETQVKLTQNELRNFAKDYRELLRTTSPQLSNQSKIVPMGTAGWRITDQDTVLIATTEEKDNEVSVTVREQGPSAMLSRQLRQLGGPAPDATDSERVTFYRRQRLYWDIGLVILYGGLAIYAGMQEFYVGQAFGTVNDYVNIFFWGIGTKVTLDAVYALVDKIAGSITVREPV